MQAQGGTPRLPCVLLRPCLAERGLAMKLREVLAAVGGIVVHGEADVQVQYGLSADLMSDVLRFGREGMLLITGLTNPQVVRTAEMIGLPALLFVRAKLPPPETVQLAREAHVSLLATRFTMYEASGLLFKAGLAGIGPCGGFVQTDAR
jgi:hypothetical protein